MNRRTRNWLILGSCIVVAGFLAWVKFGAARRENTTADELARYVNSLNMAQLSPARRSAAFKELEEKVNGLSLEERRKWWGDGQWRNWFDQMTETEKGEYIDATLPTGFKQVLNSFEKLSDDRRRRAIDNAMQQLKKTHHLVTDHEPGHDENMYGTNPPPVLSAELENRARMAGFKTFYTESSAQTKAELAPLLEELQDQLERSRFAGQ
jgi:hypothetical protein